MPALRSIMRRSEESSQPMSPVYIAGFCVVGVILLGLGTWILIRFQRKRAVAKRENIRGAAFLSVRGLVKESVGAEVGKEQPNKLPVQTDGFSREQINSSVILPDKVLARPPKISTPDDVINFHRQSGTFPQPFSPKPFSFALAAGSLAPRPLSASTSQSRFSVMATNSSVNANPTTGTAQKVRQMFDPVLPDELLLSRIGEQLTLVQSFDDGWCLVGRESGAFVSNAKSLFKTNVAPESEVELGVVPAWCFLKSVPGLRTERPIRSTSLGITVQLSGPNNSSREETISWSNF